MDFGRPGRPPGSISLVFGSFLAPFWVNFGSVLAHFRSRGGPGEAPGTLFSKVLFWGPLFMLFGSILGPFWPPFWSHFGVCFRYFFPSDFFMNFGVFWDPFWLHFGSILGSF